MMELFVSKMSSGMSYRMITDIYNVLSSHVNAGEAVPRLNVAGAATCALRSFRLSDDACECRILLELRYIETGCQDGRIVSPALRVRDRGVVFSKGVAYENNG